MKSNRKPILILVLLMIPVRCHGDSATITMPAAVGFLVTDVNGPVLSTPMETEVSFSDASLTPGNSIRFSIKADASNFTRPSEAGGFITCDKVTWVTTGDINGTGSAGVLSSISYGLVFQSTADFTSGSTQVGWTLAPVGASVFAGDHMLTATWKVESL